MKQIFKGLLFLLVLIAISGISKAQERYAVLITGDYASEGIPLDEQWNQGQGKNTDGLFEEFWHDTYLIWEMLVNEKGFSDGNVFILFADGVDFSSSEMGDRYKANVYYPEYYPITDYSATINNVENVFNGLANGTGGFPQVTEDDFLFVWTFDHGGPEPPPQPGPVYMYLMDGIMWDYEFSALTDQIQANKKVFWMQQCRSGGFYDDLEGTSTIFHSACQPLEYARVADDRVTSNIVWLENEIINGESHRHGEFNYHCYSPTVGFSPDYVDNFYGEPFAEADENNDGYVSILETYNWEDTHESIDVGGSAPGEDPLYSDLGGIGEFTSFEYPTLLHTNISSVETHRGLIGISKDITVTSGNKLQFIDNAIVHILNANTLTVEAGANLVIGDNVTFYGNDGYNKIIVNGSMQIGTGVTFNSIEEIELHGLYNEFTYTTFNDNTKLVNYGSTLFIDNSEFINCDMACSSGADVNISNTVFDNTWLYLFVSFQEPDKTANLSNCTFSSDPYNANSAILVRYYNNFNIQNNSISGFNTGIDVRYAGDGSAGNQNIEGNTIYNNISGILMYSSDALIFSNNIHDNYRGAEFQNTSNVSFFGTQSNVQYVKDNDSYEVYAAERSFPLNFHYNEIFDVDNSGNPEDPILYHNTAMILPGSRDIANNCWDNSFVASEDLHPYQNYIYNPTWCEGFKDNPIPGADEEMYNNAYDDFKAGNYEDAETTYLSLINDYNESVFAHAAIKDLYSLEFYVDNDYDKLKNYYRTNDSILIDSTLAILAEFMANQCDIRLENWQTAISWYEWIFR